MITKYGKEREFRSANAMIRVLPRISLHGIIDRIDVVHVAAFDTQEQINLTRLASFYVGKAETVWNRLPSTVTTHRCDAAQFSDMMVCPCGLRWDVNDPQPPLCPYERANLFRRTYEPITPQEAEQIVAEYQKSTIAAKAAGIVAQPLKPYQVRQAARRLSALYSTSYEAPTARLMDRGGILFVSIVMAAVALYLTWSYTRG
jgi:hypothetical protein